MRTEVARFIMADERLTQANAAKFRADRDYAAAAIEFRELWNKLTPEEQHEVNEACSNISPRERMSCRP